MSEKEYNLYHMIIKYIQDNKINSIEDVEDKTDCFSMPTGKVGQVI